MASVSSQPVTTIRPSLTPRPPLPLERNEHLATFDPSTMEEPVKFQVITREGQDIIIGRVKVPTDVKHAFVLRRFDTGAISLSTMFRAAFPSASVEAEKAESTWVRTNFDTSGANGGGRLRLAGTWVSPALANHIATSYQIAHVVAPLSVAVPNVTPRSTQQGELPAPAPTPSTPSVLPTISQATSSPRAPVTASPRTQPVSTASPVRSQPPTKRRKESPAPATPPAPVSSRSRATATPHKSAPSSSPPKSITKRKTPKHDTEEEAEVPGPSHDDDVAEQRQLIARLKAEAAAAAAATTATVNTVAEIVSLNEEPSTPTQNKKRSLEDEQTPPLRFDLDKIKEIEEQAASGIVVDRAIVPLKKSKVNLNPNQKALAWGSLALAIGVAASTYIPTFWM